eukprot:364520-Chlamydomonas_euryale.AAC.4
MDGWMGVRCVTSLIAQPTPGKWIKRGQSANTPSQGPQAVEKRVKATEAGNEDGEHVDAS